MFYKLMNGDIVVDLVKKIHYVRYLPKSKRWVNTDSQSANGVMNGAGTSIYHLAGRACLCPDELTEVMIVEIKEEEYNALAHNMGLIQQENAALRQEVNSLKL